MNLPVEQQACLQHLAQAVLSRSAHLQTTDRCLFGRPFSVERAQQLDADAELSKRVDAFVARFRRLQGTLGDRLIPALLTALREPLGAVIDNLHRAERLGWLDSTDEWLSTRKLRHQMIHAYIKDSAILASALQAGHGQVGRLIATTNALLLELQRRGWLTLEPPSGDTRA